MEWNVFATFYMPLFYSLTCIIASERIFFNSISSKRLTTIVSNKFSLSTAASSRRDEPLCCARSRNLLHSAARRLHRRAADQRAQLRRKVSPQNSDRRAVEYMVSYASTLISLSLLLSIDCSFV